jgi:hypothetical protein
LQMIAGARPGAGWSRLKQPIGPVVDRADQPRRSSEPVNRACRRPRGQPLVLRRGTAEHLFQRAPRSVSCPTQTPCSRRRWGGAGE